MTKVLGFYYRSFISSYFQHQLSVTFSIFELIRKAPHPVRLIPWIIEAVDTLELSHNLKTGTLAFL